MNLPGPSIPLGSAALCLDCDILFSVEDGRCPKGDTRSWVLIQPFLDRARRSDSSACWVWDGYVKPNGYGSIQVGAATEQAHRIVFRVLSGRIPDGLDLDHLCRNRACVNPGHLEPVSRSENLRRGQSGRVTTVQVHEARFRRELGDLIKDIASDLGVDDSTVSRYISGSRQPVESPTPERGGWAEYVNLKNLIEEAEGVLLTISKRRHGPSSALCARMVERIRADRQKEKAPVSPSASTQPKEGVPVQ